MKTEKKKKKRKRKKVLTDGLSEIGYQHQKIDVQARKCFHKTSLNILRKKNLEKMKVMISLSSLFSILLCKTVFDENDNTMHPLDCRLASWKCYCAFCIVDLLPHETDMLSEKKKMHHARCTKWHILYWPSNLLNKYQNETHVKVYKVLETPLQEPESTYDLRLKSHIWMTYVQCSVVLKHTSSIIKS